MLTERSARVVAAVKLHRTAARRRAGRFLVEGPNLVEAAARHGLICEVFATAAAAARYDALLSDLGVPAQLVSERAAKALSETVTPAGLVAVCRVPNVDLDSVLDGTPNLVAVVVGVGEPGNAGTMIRIADAMGADAVILTGHAVDPYNGKCLRASAGSIFTVPVISGAATAGAATAGATAGTTAVVAALRASGLQVLATTPRGELSLDDADSLLGRPTAWLFGAESQGLPDALADAADHRLYIPMGGGAESLNVAAAAAICLYQSARAARSGRGGRVP